MFAILIVYFLVLIKLFKVYSLNRNILIIYAKIILYIFCYLIFTFVTSFNRIFKLIDSNKRDWLSYLHIVIIPIYVISLNFIYFLPNFSYFLKKFDSLKIYLKGKFNSKKIQINENENNFYLQNDN
jgi:hypothetical protein